MVKVIDKYYYKQYECIHFMTTNWITTEITMSSHKIQWVIRWTDVHTYISQWLPLSLVNIIRGIKVHQTLAIWKRSKCRDYFNSKPLCYLRSLHTNAVRDSDVRPECSKSLPMLRLYNYGLSSNVDATLMPRGSLRRTTFQSTLSTSSTKKTCCICSGKASKLAKYGIC
jgi:hypothetical protein